MFRALGTSLASHGYSTRQVRRLLEEWRAHVEDSAEAWIEQGYDRANARRFALEALGEEETLLESVLSSGIPRSHWRRHPALLFLIGPALAYVGILVLVLLAALLIDDFLPFDSGLGLLCTRISPCLPQLWGALLLGWLWRSGLRHGCTWRWPAAASLLLLWLTSISRLGLHPEGGGELALTGIIQLGQVVAPALVILLSVAHRLHEQRRPKLTTQS